MLQHSAALAASAGLPAQPMRGNGIRSSSTADMYVAVLWCTQCSVRCALGSQSASRPRLLAYHSKVMPPCNTTRQQRHKPHCSLHDDELSKGGHCALSRLAERQGRVVVAAMLVTRYLLCLAKQIPCREGAGTHDIYPVGVLFATGPPCCCPHLGCA